MFFFNVNNNKMHFIEGKDSTCLERMEKARPWFSKTQLLSPLSQLMDLVVADGNKTDETVKTGWPWGAREHCPRGLCQRSQESATPSPSPSLRRGLGMPQPHSHRGGPPRPSQLPSGISWRSSHRAHAGFWKSVGTHSLLTLYALKKNVVDNIHGGVGPCLFVPGWEWDGRQMSRGPGNAARCCVMDTALMMWIVSFSEGPAQRGTVAGGAWRVWKQTWGGQAMQRWREGCAVRALQQQFSVGEGLLIHPENPEAQSSPRLTEPTGESGSPCGSGGIPKGMTSVPGYKPGRAARGGGTACPKARRAPALCPLHKPAQPAEKELSR